jgi:hypothetical protein
LVSRSPQPSGYFGISVSVDYPLVVVSATGEKASNVANAGKVYTFLLTSSPMPLSAITSPTPVIGQRFGVSVDINNHQLLVGTFTQSGKAFVYSFAPAGALPWNFVSELTPHDASGSFGYRVAIVNDIALIGAPNDSGDRGAVYEYRNIAGIWLEVAKHYSPQRMRRFFGSAVDLEEGGRRAVVGANGSPGTGAAYVFELQ